MMASFIEIQKITSPTLQDLFTTGSGSLELSLCSSFSTRPCGTKRICHLTSRRWPTTPFLQFFLVKKAVDPPSPLPFEHLVDNLRPLRGHLFGHHEFCNFFTIDLKRNFGLAKLGATPFPTLNGKKSAK